MRKRSVNISGHQTSISLEDPFWDALKTEADRQGISLNALISKVDAERTKTAQEKAASSNLSSCLRLYILELCQSRLAQ
jgi:predicted DNA-binding ribbon-helix-helix protein